MFLLERSCGNNSRKGGNNALKSLCVKRCPGQFCLQLERKQSHLVCSLILSTLFLIKSRSTSSSSSSTSAQIGSNIGSTLTPIRGPLGQFQLEAVLELFTILVTILACLQSHCAEILQQVFSPKLARNQQM